MINLPLIAEAANDSLRPLRSIVWAESDPPLDSRFLIERILQPETNSCEERMGNTDNANYFLASQPSTDKKFVVDTTCDYMTFKKFHLKNIHNAMHNTLRYSNSLEGFLFQKAFLSSLQGDKGFHN